MIGEMRAPRKNFAALARLLTLEPHLSALVVGEQTPQVIWQLSQTGAQVKFVRFCPREELNLMMNQARIGFVPNLLDAAPRVIQDFMAAGVPADHFGSVLGRAMRACGRESPVVPPGRVRRFFKGPWRPRTVLAGCLEQIAADSNHLPRKFAHSGSSPERVDWISDPTPAVGSESQPTTVDRPICISIVIPAYNEADNVGPLHAAISMAADPLGVPWELILVDDGSADRTWETIGKLHAIDPRVRGVKLHRNSGQTAASEAGLRRARGDYVVTMDADLQNDPSDLPMLFTTIERGGWDMVTGTRVKSRARGDNIVRRISSRIANRVRNWISDEQISDSGCAYRIFRRDCLERIKFYHGMHRFLPTLFRLEGFRVVEVDVKTNPRHAGESKYGIWNRVFKATVDLLAVRWMKKRHIRYDIDAEHGAEADAQPCLRIFDEPAAASLDRSTEAA
jgi:hypothetical protein